MKTYLLFVVALLLCALSGCATPPDTQPLLDAHLAAFAKAQPHQASRVPRADGNSLAVREFGAAFKGQGPSIVLMHGFPDNQHLYDLLIPQLAATHHVVSFDFLGWGDSEKPGGHLYNVASQRADLDAVVRHFALRAVVPVLHDLSGQVGIDWALDNPAQTSALVLLNTYYQNMPTLKEPEAIQTYSTLEEEPRMRAFDKPVLVIFGADDPYLDAGVARDFEALFPRSRLHLLPNAGHYVQLDRAPDVAAAIKAGLGAP